VTQRKPDIFFRIKMYAPRPRCSSVASMHDRRGASEQVYRITLKAGIAKFFGCSQAVAENF
jgi:hypothetical protein